MLRPIIVSCLTWLTFGSAASCGDGVIVDIGGEVDTLTVTVVDSNSIVVEAISMEVGDSAVLSALASNQLGQPLGQITPTWQSSRTTVVTASSSGVLHAVGAGTATVTASYQGVTASLPVTVSEPGSPPPPPPGGSGFVFNSDWSTATGGSQAALSDANKAKPWTVILNNANLMQVVSTSSEGLDFPTTNVLKITADNGGSGIVPGAQPQFRTTDNYIPIPQVGESIFYRYYLRIEVPDSYTDDPSTHGTQDADGFNQRNWMHQVQTRSDGTYDLRIAVTNGANSNAWPDFFWKVNLNKRQTYRIEQEVERISSGQFLLHARVYNAAGQLVFSDDDFENANGSASLDTGVPLNLGLLGAASLGAFRTGLNSLVGTHAPGTFPFTFGYIGGVAICRTNWCGPYQNGM